MKKDIQKIIQERGAYPSQLRKQIQAWKCDSKKVLLFSREWFHITRVFGLNAPRSLNNIALKLLGLPIESKQAQMTEILLQQVARIAFDDLGMDRGTSGMAQMIHYRLFEKQCLPLIKKHKDIRFYQKFEYTQETKDVTLSIQESFKGSVPDILVQYLIVESIALEIVNMMYPLYKKCDDIYKDDTMMEYVILHQKIEGEHSIESLKMIHKYIEIFPNEEDILYLKLEEKIIWWSRLWWRFEQILFK